MATRTDLAKSSRIACVVIGVSAGGLEALSVLLSGLPANFPATVAVVQHRVPLGDDRLIPMLGKDCLLEIREPNDKEEALPGRIYLAPANYHLLFEKDRSFALSIDARVLFARPAIDLLFESAARAYGPELVGVVLTGANNDGAEGLKAIRQRGGLAIVQDPATAAYAAMPRAALETAGADWVLLLEDIAPQLARLARIV